MKSVLAASICAIAMLLAAHAIADSWLPPEISTYLSSGRTYRLTVVPRALNTPDEGGRRFCEGTLDKRDGDGYQQVWRKRLVNADAPLSAIVAERTGYVVTFDNWGQAGYGDNVVAIYAPTGELVRKLALADFLSKVEIEKLQHSVSSIWWGGKHRFNHEQDQVKLAIATRTAWWQPSRTISIRLTDGAVVAD